MWHYVKDLKPVGPISAAEIGRLIQAGQINGKTLVWTDSMENWTAAEDIAALSPILPRRPPPIPSDRASTIGRLSTVQKKLPADQPLARPWPRFLARTVDLWITMLVTVTVLSILADAYFPQFLVWIDTVNEGVFGLICLPLVMLLTAFSMTAFGTTLGKALFGIRVRNLTQNGPLRFHLMRELQVWVQAMALGIPLFALFTYAQQYNRVSAGRPASYDEGRARVEAKGISAFRKLAAAVLVVLVFGAVVSLSVLGKQDAADARETQVWLNPVTGKPARISKSWTATKAETDNAELFQFSSDYFFAEALFGTERSARNCTIPQNTGKHSRRRYPKTCGSIPLGNRST